MLRFDFRVESSDLEVIMVKSDEILTPATLVSFNHSIALILDLMSCDDPIARSEDLINMHLRLLASK